MRMRMRMRIPIIPIAFAVQTVRLRDSERSFVRPGLSERKERDRGTEPDLCLVQESFRGTDTEEYVPLSKGFGSSLVLFGLV